MNEQLYGPDVLRYVDALIERAPLTSLQTRRLRGVVELLDVDGRFVLDDALRAGDFAPDQKGQDNFRDFRIRINQAAAAAGVNLRLELSSRKTTPDRRHGWFAVGDLGHDDLAAPTPEDTLRASARSTARRVTRLERRVDAIFAAVEEIRAHIAAARPDAEVAEKTTQAPCDTDRAASQRA